MSYMWDNEIYEGNVTIQIVTQHELYVGHGKLYDAYATIQIVTQQELYVVQ